MTREIKFRAWDKKENKMEYFPHPTRDLIFTDKGYKTVHFHRGCPIFDMDRDFELQQYTDLKDKNGKEIYEGDIVTAPWYFDKPEVVEIGINFYYALREYAIEDELEIIGNIYENPELLEAK